MNNNLKITISVVYNDGETENEWTKETEGSLFSIKGSFEAAEENLGKLEKAITEWANNVPLQDNEE